MFVNPLFFLQNILQRITNYRFLGRYCWGEIIFNVGSQLIAPVVMQERQDPNANWTLLFVSGSTNSKGLGGR